MKILVAPLDWGLGHASRCIPVIRMLLAKDAEVVIASSGLAGTLLQLEFPSLTYLPLPGYGITYSVQVPMEAQMIAKLPSLLMTVRREHQALGNIIREHGIDAVISDNRFGMFSEKIPSVFITHQLFIKAGKLKFAESLLRKINHHFIGKFDRCWVPDFPGEKNLSGMLSHGASIPPNVVYTGPLSRFGRNDASARDYDALFLLSGPEPSRTLLEDKFLRQLQAMDGRFAMVRGTTISRKHTEADHIRVFDLLAAAELEALLHASEVVFCRSGYSSVMDLSAAGKRAVLVPTPGQPEQEYLALYHEARGNFCRMDEQAFHIASALECAGRVVPGFQQPPDLLLETAVDGLLALASPQR